MLGGNPTSAPATNLLYAGEQFDVASQMYYNRARWYDTNSGRFNRVDPFTGNNVDPQSLHKYNYAHNNPINGIDPSGFSLTNLLFAVVIGVLLLMYLDFGRQLVDIVTSERYDLTKSCYKYNQANCVAENGIIYDDSAIKECEKEARELQIRYEGWIQVYWSTRNGRTYTTCDRYVYKILDQDFTMDLKWFFEAGGSYQMHYLTGTINYNFVGIFHRCNQRRIKLGGQDWYDPGETSDALFNPWDRGFPQYLDNRWCGNPYVQPGRKSETDWWRKWKK